MVEVNQAERLSDDIFTVEDNKNEIDKSIAKAKKLGLIK
jgi:hypothetical protein